MSYLKELSTSDEIFEKCRRVREMKEAILAAQKQAEEEEVANSLKSKKLSTKALDFLMGNLFPDIPDGDREFVGDQLEKLILTDLSKLGCSAISMPLTPIQNHPLFKKYNIGRKAVIIRHKYIKFASDFSHSPFKTFEGDVLVFR